MPSNVKFSESLTKDMDERGVELRKLVLFKTLQMEDVTTKVLAHLLDIDLSDSVILGHSTMALGFNHRVQLLIEIGAMKREHKSKLQWFLQIRNQFMHNWRATTMEECLKFANVKTTSLLTAFPPKKETDLERQLIYAYRDLCTYVQTCALELMDTLIEKLRNDIQGKHIAITKKGKEEVKVVALKNFEMSRAALQATIERVRQHSS